MKYVIGGHHDVNVELKSWVVFHQNRSVCKNDQHLQCVCVCVCVCIYIYIYIYIYIDWRSFPYCVLSITKNYCRSTKNWHKYKKEETYTSLVCYKETKISWQRWGIEIERVGELDTLYKFPTTTIMSITVTPDHAKREGGNGSNQGPFSSKN